MELPSRLDVVVCLVHLLLVVPCGAVHRQPPATELTADLTADLPADLPGDLPADLPSDLPSDLPADLPADANRTGRLIRDCSDLSYGTPSGKYLVLEDINTPTPVFCDMEDGEGWTLVQRRADILPRQDFFLDWQSYKLGFGSLDGEFWWGLQFLWQLTSQLDRVYELRVDLWDWDGETRYATYQHFTIASEEDSYRLDLDDYAGDAGDGLVYHIGAVFSTKDRDRDEWDEGSCANSWKGAWWYRHCYDSNLNGFYAPRTADGTGLAWQPWRDDYSMNATTMKIRPTKKL